MSNQIAPAKQITESQAKGKNIVSYDARKPAIMAALPQVAAR